MQSFDIKTSRAKAIATVEQVLTYGLMLSPWLVFIYLIYTHVL